MIFPGGRLALQIFEPRYLDMIKRCMGEGEGFGVVLALPAYDGEANVVGPPTASQGTYTSIIDFNQLPNGLLGILAEGEKRFIIHNRRELTDGLLMGEVEFLDQDPDYALPDHQEQLAKILQSFAEHPQVARLNYQIDYQSAGEVSARLAELLPCRVDIKKVLFEISDPLERLDMLEQVIVDLQDQANR